MQSKTKLFPLVWQLILIYHSLMAPAALWARLNVTRDPFSAGMSASHKVKPVSTKLRLISTTVCSATTDLVCYQDTAIIQAGQQVYTVQRRDRIMGWQVTEILPESVTLIKNQSQANVSPIKLKLVLE